MSDKGASRASRLRLAPGREVRAGHPNGNPPLLVYPSGTVQLNESAAAILALCDGTRTREEIIAQVLPSPGDEALVMDIREFLDAAVRYGWVLEE